MVKMRVLRYIIAEKVYNKGTSGFVICCILLGVGLYAFTGDIFDLIFIVALTCLIILSTILKEYEEINAKIYVPTPLIVVERKYNEISNRVDLVKFLDINKDEKLKLEEALYEYDRSIELLKNENKK